MTISKGGPKWYIHVNQHTIRKNINAEVKEPPIAIKRGKNGVSVYANNVRIPDGSHIIYSPDNPILSCGARLVIETPTEPVIVS